MSRDPSKSRPLSDNVKRMMWLERASPRSSDVYSAKREFTENDRLFCHKQGLLFMEAAAMGLKMEDFAPLYMRSQLAGVVDHYFCSSFQNEADLAKLLQVKHIDPKYMKALVEGEYNSKGGWLGRGFSVFQSTLTHHKLIAQKFYLQPRCTLKMKKVAFTR